MEPMVEAVTKAVERLRGDLHTALAGQSAEMLNWRPVPDGNSIAGLIAHMLESSLFLLQVGSGQPIAPDRQAVRDAQFTMTAPDAATLLAQLDAGWEPILRGIGACTADSLVAEHDLRGNRYTGAWFLLRTCDHLYEHWGQIQLTRDLYAARD
jgi:uncharacterized damage-inducible protein DinB